jgi:hypothetical protein
MLCACLGDSIRRLWLTWRFFVLRTDLAVAEDFGRCGSEDLALRAKFQDQLTNLLGKQGICLGGFRGNCHDTDGRTVDARL